MIKSYISKYSEMGLYLDREIAPHLTVGEVICKCDIFCANYAMNFELLDKWTTVRNIVNSPITINSGFRCGNHYLEKEKTGQHFFGKALDLSWPEISKIDFINIIHEVFRKNGIGIYEYGVHVDVGEKRTWFDNSTKLLNINESIRIKKILGL